MAAEPGTADLPSVVTIERRGAPAAIADGRGIMDPDAAPDGTLQVAAGVVIAAGVIAALYFGRDILIPLVLALLLGFVLDPVVVRLNRLGLPRSLSVFVVVGVTLASLVLAGWFLGGQVRTLGAELPNYQSTIREKLQTLRQDLRSPGAIAGVIRMFEGIRRDVEGTTGGATPPVEPQPLPLPLPPTPSAEEAPAKPADAPSTVRVLPTESPPLERAMVWLEAVATPLLNTGIVLVFVVLVLLDRRDLRDRLLRLMGGNLHSATDAMDEAGARISRYLTMHLTVNVLFGLPLALGLWIIGVPGAMLWGACAVALRFVPYLGSMVAAIFPLALAFAVDPGWEMLIWTGVLIVTLELISNNFFEPWLYGSSTGLSTIAVMVAATFWTLLWGPIGLVLSTPLTACALVVGRFLPPLRFLTVLLGSQPVLDPPTRVYQRLLAGDTIEAIDLSIEELDDRDLTRFHDRVTVPVLRMATIDHARVASVRHRHRVLSGMSELIAEVREHQPAGQGRGVRPVILTIGAQWEVDAQGADLLAHALDAVDLPARPIADVVLDLHGPDPDVRQARFVCVSIFNPDPLAVSRLVVRRIRRGLPEARIVLVPWMLAPSTNSHDRLSLEGQATGTLGRAEADQALLALERLPGVDAVVATVADAVVRLRGMLADPSGPGHVAPPPVEDDAARVAAIEPSGLRNPAAEARLAHAAKRAADSFDLPVAMVSIVDADDQIVAAASGRWPRAVPGGGRPDRAGTRMPRDASLCAHVVAAGEPMVVSDVASDLRFASNVALAAMGVRFYVGAPLRDGNGHVLGTLCLYDDEVRSLEPKDLQLLQAMADDLMAALAEDEPT